MSVFRFARCLFFPLDAYIPSPYPISELRYLAACYPCVQFACQRMPSFSIDIVARGVRTASTTYDPCDVGSEHPSAFSPQLHAACTSMSLMHGRCAVPQELMMK